MANAVPFLNYDDPAVYQLCQAEALKQSTQNFVVEFGRLDAQIAFDVKDEHIRSLLSTPAPAERPVRWM